MGADPALVAYEAFAAVYNEFNHANDYEMWLGQVLLPELRKYGLSEGGKALDVGCGTGRAFRPLLRRGWQVHGCDLSPAMLKLAAQEGSTDVSLEVSDMRALPRLGSFDLVLSLNDSVNYLLGDNDLASALAGMRANLAENGLLIFDVNSSSTYVTGYSEVQEVEHEGSRWVWTGRGEVAPSVFEAEIAGDGLKPIRHLERFRSEREVVQAMRSAGIEILAGLGMSEDEGEVVLSAPPDERRDYKLVFIGAVARPQGRYQVEEQATGEVERPSPLSCNQIGIAADRANNRTAGAARCPDPWPGHRAPFLALDQPFLWVETTGTASSIAAMFMPSPLPFVCGRVS